MVKISIIVPVYQVEEYLPRCVDSIRAQSFRDFECILVDDGSPDRCGKMCDTYASEDSRFRVIHKSNGGLSSARNAALDVIKGQYIMFVDSDDVIHPKMLEWMLGTLEKENADIVSAALKSFSALQPDVDTDTASEYKILTRLDFIDYLLPENFGKIGVTACGKLYRREIFEILRYPEGKIYEDLHVYLDVLLQCEKIAVTEKPLYFYYQNPASITRSNYLAHDRFGEFMVRRGYIDFFAQRGLEDQRLMAMNDYLTFFMRNFFAVRLRYLQRWESMTPYMEEFRHLLPQICKNPYVCRMRRICARLMVFCPRLAYILAKKTIPDCLPEELR